MSRARILIVDDDESIGEFVSMALADEGYDVVTAPNGATALELIELGRPDVILLDMRMPIMDGWEFARRYRQRTGPPAPIIVITAARDADDRAAQVEADDVLAKPFNLDDLLDLVDRYAHPGSR